MITMASVCDDPNGRRRILFVDPDGNRKAIRLGKCDRKTADSVCRHVEALLASKITGQPLERSTAAWLSNIGDTLKAKLANVGLVEMESRQKPQVGSFATLYISKKTDIKPASLLAVEQTVRNLREFFGDERLLSSITAGDCEDFKRWLMSDARTRGAVRENSPGLSNSTVAKRMQRCAAIFQDAVKRKLITENPFKGIKQPKATNKDRQAYIPADTIERLIEYCPSAEWRLLLAISRYLGVRVPSEPFSMSWDCVDWERSRLRVPSPKTAVHDKSFRMVPIVPQVMKHLRDVFELAPEGSIYIFHALRERESTKQAEKGFWQGVNLRQQLKRIMTRAGVKPWPKLWHNLRASAETDFANTHPIHVVCEWLGNTKAVAQAHYLQVTDSHFAEAIREKDGAENGAQVAQKAAQQATADNRKDERDLTQMQEPQGVLQPDAVLCDSIHDILVAAIGFEPMTSRL
jgi:integrase